MLADLPAAEVWTNWVGNQSFTPGYAAAPRDEEEVAALVRDASERGVGVRVSAARHSFTPIVETDGLLLDLSALRGSSAPTRGQARDGAVRDADPRLLRAAVGRRARAEEPGRIDASRSLARCLPRRTIGIRDTCFSGGVRGSGWSPRQETFARSTRANPTYSRGSGFDRMLG